MKKTIAWVAILIFLVINTGCSITTAQRNSASKPIPLSSRPQAPSSVHLSLGNPSGANANNPNNYLTDSRRGSTSLVDYLNLILGNLLNLCSPVATGKF